METENNLSVGLVLSGGGARGFAHIGVFRALEEIGIIPQIISGASMGTVIGTLIAAGHSASEIEDIVKSKTKSKMFEMIKPTMGLASHAPIKDILKKLVPEKIEDLKIPMYISTTNLTTGDNVIFSEGNLIETVLASSSIPVAFNPIKIKGEYFVDGGLTKNFPASTIRKQCDFLIGSHVNYISKKAELNSIKDIMERCFRVGVYNTVREDKELCDLFIDPKEVRKFETLDFKQIPEIIEIGYKSAMQLFSEKKEVLSRLRV